MNEPLPPHIPLGMRLVQLRRRFNLSRAALAQVAHISKSTVEELENGQTRRPRKLTLSKLAAALQMQVSDLEQILGLVLLSSQISDAKPISALLLTGNKGERASAPRYSKRAERVAIIMDHLRPDQQDLLESYALQLHALRAVLPVPQTGRTSGGRVATSLEKGE